MSDKEQKNKKIETVADILEEMRDMGNYQRYSGDHAHALADRIEAAWKRERAKVEADALSVGGVVEAARHKPVGNTAAMREALEDMYNILEKLQLYTPHINDVSLMRSFRGRICRAKKIVDAALSAPARNCDIYTTSGEADRALTEYCSKMAETGECVRSCPYREAKGGCAFGWILAASGTKG